MARGLNRQTAETVSNVLSQKASPVDIANSIKSANQGDIRNAAVSAANAMHGLASMLSKVAGNLAPPLLVANIVSAKKAPIAIYI